MEGSHCISDLYMSRSFVLSKTAPDGFTRLDLSSFAGWPLSNPEGLPCPLLHPEQISDLSLSLHAGQCHIPDKPSLPRPEGSWCRQQMQNNAAQRILKAQRQRYSLAHHPAPAVMARHLLGSYTPNPALL